ncbi:MAG: NAD-dependent epimerase/dehydratase family protein [Anaerolineaceae bacterium]|nr:NAD-dependent epimerase/dehydratase family protein [Anaerolineaceae bacterium]
MENRLAQDLDHILANTENLWDELRGQRLFITGGTGFFGCWLLESFCWANDKLNLKATAHVLTRNPDAFQLKVPHLACHPAIKLVTGDVRNFDFPAGSFSHIIHAATEASATLNDHDPLAMFDTIVTGTHHTLEFARKCGTQKFLLTSSGAVYGRQPPEITHIPEEYPGAPDPTDPRSAYGEGKRAAETLCSLYAKQEGFEAKIARCFAFVGPYLPLDRHYAIGNFIRDGLAGKTIRVNGDGTPIRSYLYAADLAIWLWTILLRGESCRSYNIGSEEAISILALAKLVAERFEFQPGISIVEEAIPGIQPQYYVPSTQRARIELGLRQTINLSNALQMTLSAW